ncbi:hypothetical protein FSOLCH5_000485 [Fusarium solani]|jgi:hypothetical protein|nr:hypothetical protein NW759_005849 [Fusarium solani]
MVMDLNIPRLTVRINAVISMIYLWPQAGGPERGALSLQAINFFNLGPVPLITDSAGHRLLAGLANIIGHSVSRRSPILSLLIIIRVVRLRAICFYRPPAHRYSSRPITPARKWR